MAGRSVEKERDFMEQQELNVGKELGISSPAHPLHKISGGKKSSAKGSRLHDDRHIDMLYEGVIEKENHHHDPHELNYSIVKRIDFGPSVEERIPMGQEHRLNRESVTEDWIHLFLSTSYMRKGLLSTSNISWTKWSKIYPNSRRPAENSMKKRNILKFLLSRVEWIELSSNKKSSAQSHLSIRQTLLVKYLD